MPLKLTHLDNNPNDRRKRTFSRHEGRVAATLGGIGTIGSGNKGMKGDVWAGDRDAGQRLMVECKATETSSVVLKLDWIDKLAKEARESSHEPVLAVRYRAGGTDHDFALLPLDRWMAFLDLPEPDVDIVVTGRQTTLKHAWFKARFLDHYGHPARLFFKMAGRMTPKSWVVLPLDRLKRLYQDEAARLTAPLS